MQLIKTLERSREIFDLDTYTFQSVLKGSYLNKIKDTTIYDNSLEYPCRIDFTTRTIEVINVSRNN